MRPTFSSFYVAKRGLDAARANLQVTGQNMTNVDSEGYTRQRVDTYAVGASGYGMRYASPTNSLVGEGVMIRGISQLRDPYLDVRYRREHAKLGDSAAQLEGLNDLGYLFDNATEEGFSEQFSDLVKQLQSLANKPTDTVSENIVKTSSTMLMQMFNHTADQLEVIRNQQIVTLRDGAIQNANECIKNIAKMNAEIKSASISGNPALELLDQRNLLMDQLSQYVNMEVTTKNVDIGSGVKVEELSINMLALNGEKINLIDNDKYTEFSFSLDDATGKASIFLRKPDGTPVGSTESGGVILPNGDISNQLTTGAFNGYLKVLNDRGEFGDPPSQNRGIAYYEEMMNSVAREFASVMNKANSTDALDKPLFASKDGGIITAKNICISEQWKNANDTYITNTKKDPQPGMSNKDDSENILYMISLFSSKQEFKTDKGVAFQGTFQEGVTHISSTLGLSIKDMTRQSKTHKVSIDDIDSQRQSISAVNIDEEGINLIMYNQSLNASSRFMTTLDEAVDTIINKMGVVGR